MNLINRPCTILRRNVAAGEDRYGNKKTSTVEVETVCELQQAPTRADSSESARNNELPVSEWVAFFNPDEEVAAEDGLTVDGVEFEVNGDPWIARDPATRMVSHIEARLTRAGGPSA